MLVLQCRIPSPFSLELYSVMHRLTPSPGPSVERLAWFCLPASSPLGRGPRDYLGLPPQHLGSESLSK